MAKQDFQNWIIGSFDFWQRTGLVETNLTTSLVYYADRWKTSYTGTVTGTPTIRCEETVIPTFSRRSAKIKFQRNASTFTTAFEQRIEADNAREIARYGTASASIQVYAPVSGCQVRCTWSTPSVRDTHTIQNQIAQSTVTMLTSGAFELVKFENVTIPVAAKLGLAVKFEVIVPSSTDGAVIYLYVGEAMLNCGKKVKPFQMAGKDISEELTKCQRYFEKSYDIDTKIGTSSTYNGSIFAILAVSDTNRESMPIPFKTRKRALPTVRLYSPETGAINQVHYIYDGSDRTSYVLDIGTSAAMGGPQTLTDKGHVGFQWAADAEIN